MYRTPVFLDLSPEEGGGGRDENDRKLWTGDHSDLHVELQHSSACLGVETVEDMRTHFIHARCKVMPMRYNTLQPCHPDSKRFSTFNP